MTKNSKYYTYYEIIHLQAEPAQNVTRAMTREEQMRYVQIFNNFCIS